MTMSNIKKAKMTLMEVYQEMRSAGISSSPKAISAGVACGAYPFGRVVSTGETGRRTLEIYRVDFEAWLETKIPEPTSQLHLVSRIG